MRSVISLLACAFLGVFLVAGCAGESAVGPDGDAGGAADVGAGGDGTGTPDDKDNDGYTVKDGDCDDTNPDINPAGVDICGDGVDQNCDGADLPCSDLDKDGDGFSPNQGDCDDANKDVNPDAKEVPYNGRDDDCDTKTPDDDLDGDGFSKVGGGDCNDGDKTIFPGATEVPYDGIDQDCSGKDLDDVDKDGYPSTAVSGGTDCNDKDPKVSPGAEEIPYDTVDQNCDKSDLVTGNSFTVYSAGSISLSDVVVAGDKSAIVAWQEYNSSNQTYRVRVQPVSSTGRTGRVATLYSVVSTSGAAYNYLGAASSGSGYLVAFSIRTGTSPNYSYRLIARLLTASGAPTGATITVRASTSSNQRDIAVSYAAGRYAVVFTEYVPSASAERVYLQMVDANGSLYSSLRALTDGKQNDDETAIASNGSSHVVVWRRYQTSTQTYDVYARRLSTTGSAQNNPYAVSSAAGNQYAPSIAYGGNTYLVSWGDRRNGAYDVYGQLLDASGTPTGPPVSTNILLSNVAQSQYVPAGVYCGGRYLASWLDTRHSTAATIYGQALTTGGKLLDSDSFKNRVFWANTASAGRPQVACYGLGHLVAFRESVSGNSRIVAVRVTPPRTP